MEPDGEIKQLLREIRDQQRGFQDELRQVWEETRKDRLEERENAERRWRRADSSMRGAKRGQLVWLVILVVLVGITLGYPTMLTSCVRGLTGSDDLIGSPEKHEARAWLNQNKNDSPLASNRFETKAEAVEFVEKLYESGAEKVYVTNVDYDEYEVKEYGGPYADSLIVDLPKDKEKRAKLFAIHTAEVVEEGFLPQRDRGQATLFFWWD
jgi:hypothetical protein